MTMRIQETSIAGHEVPCVNVVLSLKHVQQMRNEFPDAPFVATYMDDALGNRVWTLYPHRDPALLETLAKDFEAKRFDDASAKFTQPILFKPWVP